MNHDLHKLALQLAPELNQAPLYVLRQPSSLPSPVDALAYVVRGPCAPLRQHLEVVGKWEGAGPAIIFNREVEGEDAIVALLHEVAHLLPAKAIAAAGVTANEVQSDFAAMAAWAADPNPRCNEPRWVHGDHGKDFVRICLHLWWRAALAGVVMDFAHLCAGRHYDLSPAFLYWRALGNEGVQMKDERFDTILATEPPQDFQELWRADLARWMKEHEVTK